MAPKDLPEGLAEPDLQVTYVSGPLPRCSLHWELRHVTVEAAYDGKTKYGPWAYMCVHCFVDHGVGLGTGRGQRLLPGPRPTGTAAPE
ncbi:hypothetical protein AB0M46_05670 [Dactylosporangium sp. NPDC051485]|uniref:hypothetical protein n=1 Tax=Dactylosporangium sp. NPDC051485 TaxID=3154846 RepID=UPI003416F720